MARPRDHTSEWTLYTVLKDSKLYPDQHAATNKYKYAQTTLLSELDLLGKVIC